MANTKDAYVKWKEQGLLDAKLKIISDYYSYNEARGLIYNLLGVSEATLARTIKINATQGKCERCGDVGEEVHHQIRLTLSNLGDTSISLDQKNLELLCRDCHNEEHGRFKKKEVLFDENGDFLG